MNCISGYITRRLSLEEGVKQPGSWISEKDFSDIGENRGLIQPTQDTIEKIRTIDNLFNQFQGSGMSMRTGSDVFNKTVQYIVGHLKSDKIVIRMVKIYVNLKLFHRHHGTLN